MLHATGHTADGLPVHSLRTLLADLATYSRIEATTPLNEKYAFNPLHAAHTDPTAGFELLGVNPECSQ